MDDSKTVAPTLKQIATMLEFAEHVSARVRGLEKDLSRARVHFFAGTAFANGAIMAAAAATLSPSSLRLMDSALLYPLAFGCFAFTVMGVTYAYSRLMFRRAGLNELDVELDVLSSLVDMLASLLDTLPPDLPIVPVALFRMRLTRIKSSRERIELRAK